MKPKQCREHRFLWWKWRKHVWHAMKGCDVFIKPGPFTDVNPIWTPCLCNCGQVQFVSNAEARGHVIGYESEEAALRALMTTIAFIDSMAAIAKSGRKFADMLPLRLGKEIVQ